MTPDPDRFPRLFTVREANATLPLVTAICRDLSTLARDVVERRQRLALLTSGRDDNASVLYAEELVQVEEELQRDGERLQEYVQELVQLGVEPKGAMQGLVDFPCFMDERIVYLCWQLNEPEVLFWHELDAGFAGRQPVTVDTAAADGALDGRSGSM
ncbi:MAG: DUF2203 domain-containing protein [Pirellulales bacterium]